MTSSSRPLSRAYPCVFGAPTIDRVDPRIFRLTYFGKCMECTFCQDACCQYGADIDLRVVTELEKYRPELEAYLDVPRADWFREDPEDIGYRDAPEYPTGKYTRTQVVDPPEGRSFPNDGACVFLDPAGRGCRIHRFALDRGVDVHLIKPMVCLLFPVSFDQGELVPAVELTEPGELVCQGPGETLFRSARPDLLYYFGPDLVAELDAMDAEGRGGPEEAAGVIPLPVCAG
jgi:Fe-S-cluster containining protein